MAYGRLGLEMLIYLQTFHLFHCLGSHSLDKQAKIVVSHLCGTQQTSGQCQVCNYVVRLITDRL